MYLFLLPLQKNEGERTLVIQITGKKKINSNIFFSETVSVLL